MKIDIIVEQIKPFLGNKEKNIEIIYKRIEKAIEKKADIVVFPELALTGYTLKDMVPVVALWVENDIFIDELKKYSRHISIIFGGVEESKDHNFYNSAFYIEDGQIKKIHRKVYLPTYGMFDEYRYFSRGKNFRAFDTKFGRFGMLVCEDAWHTSSAHILAQDNADYIFILSSSPTRGVSTEKTHSNTAGWENINRVYASLFNIYIIFANRVGFEDGINFWGGSEIINPFGEVEKKAKYFDEDSLHFEIQKQKIRRARIYSQTRKDEDLDLTIRELERIRDNECR